MWGFKSPCSHPTVFLAVLLSLKALVRQLARLALLGVLVGLLCWPFNVLDRWADRLLALLPAFSGSPWRPFSVLLALLPVLVMPALLLLQQGCLRRGQGSGISQTMLSLEQPQQAGALLGVVPSLQRLLLWAMATLSLLPIGREGPVVQVGASAAHWLHRWRPHWFAGLAQADLLAVAGGAGLAGAFNAPLLGVVFVLEEFIGRFSSALVWPALVVGALAAAFSALVGQPEFALGMLTVAPGELLQVFWAVPIGVLAGACGALLAQFLLDATARWQGAVAQRPLWFGLLLGGLLSGCLLISGGAAGGDGELLMRHLVEGGAPTQVFLPGVFGDLLTLLLRLLAPVLVLAVGVPGGLIDPAFSLGAVLGYSLGDAFMVPELGLALGMVAGLAGATQLPVLAVLFGMRLTGDQQLLPGLLLAAVLAAYISRLLVAKPIYHALKDLASGGFADHQSGTLAREDQP